MVQWPQTLPKFLANGFSEALPNITERVEMAAGPPYTRGKSTVGEAPVIGALVVTQAQWLVLKNFYLSILAGGALPFAMNHPIDGTSREWRITEPPERSQLAPNKYRVEIEMELLP